MISTDADIRALKSTTQEFDNIVPSTGDSLTQAVLEGESAAPLMVAAAVVANDDIVVKAPPIVPPKWDKNYVPVDQMDNYLAHVRREATHYEIAYLAASAIDTAATLSCVGNGRCVEKNPLMFGAKPAPMLAIKAALSIAHFLGFQHLREVNPHRARSMAKLSMILQGGIAGVGLAHNF